MKASDGGRSEGTLSVSLVNAGETSDRDVEAAGDDLEMSRLATKRWRNYLKIIFALIGTSELFYWNSVLNLLDPLRTYIYTDYSWVSDTLNACNNIASIAVLIYNVRVGGMNPTFIITGGVILAVACLATAMTAQWAKGITGVVLLHIINIVAGAGSGFYQTGGFGVSSILPGRLTGYVSLGSGICGVLTWFIWYCVGTLAYPNPDATNTKISVWILMSLGTAALTATVCLYLWLFSIPEVAKRVAEVQQTLREEATNPNAPGYRYLFKQVWMLIVSVWLCMFATLLVFPTIGPLHWNDSAKWIQWTFFAFQLGDLVGRYAPNISAVLVIPTTPLFYTIIARMIVAPTIAILCWKLPHTGFFNSPIAHWIIMFVLAVSNGWFVSSVYINCPKAIKEEDWRSRVSSMVLVGVMVGIACGLWVAKILLVTVM